MGTETENRVIESAYECPSCSALFADEDANSARLYHCDNCGETFNADNGGGRGWSCPQCNKFARKAAEFSCPECDSGGEDGFEEAEAWRCECGQLNSLDDQECADCGRNPNNPNPEREAEVAAKKAADEARREAERAAKQARNGNWGAPQPEGGYVYYTQTPYSLPGESLRDPNPYIWQKNWYGKHEVVVPIITLTGGTYEHKFEARGIVVYAEPLSGHRIHFNSLTPADPHELAKYLTRNDGRKLKEELSALSEDGLVEHLENARDDQKPILYATLALMEREAQQEAANNA